MGGSYRGVRRGLPKERPPKHDVNHGKAPAFGRSGQHVRQRGTHCDDPKVAKSSECLRHRKKAERGGTGLARALSAATAQFHPEAGSHPTTVSSLFLLEGFEFLVTSPPSCRK